MTDPDQARKAQDALAKVSQDWMSRPGVVSVEVARRRKDGVPVDEVGIRVTVERRSSGSDGPSSESFPSSLDGIPVDVVEGSPPTLER